MKEAEARDFTATTAALVGDAEAHFGSWVDVMHRQIAEHADESGWEASISAEQVKACAMSALAALCTAHFAKRLARLMSSAVDEGNPVAEPEAAALGMIAEGAGALLGFDCELAAPEDEEADMGRLG